MKQCPNCKANYSDNSLSFCLNDGTSLLHLPDEQETQVIAPGRITTQPNFSNLSPNFSNHAVPTSNNKIVFLLVSIIALILLVVIGVVAAYFLMPQKQERTTQNSAEPAKSDDEELKKKIANLEKQLQEQKKTPVSTPAPSKTISSPLNESGKMTARVKQTGDGFLALRSDPGISIGKRLLEIPSGATVEIEDCQKSYQTIDGRRGRWCIVTYNNTTGWAFDAWLNY